LMWNNFGIERAKWGTFFYFTFTDMNALTVCRDRSKYM